MGAELVEQLVSQVELGAEPDLKAELEQLAWLELEVGSVEQLVLQAELEAALELAEQQPEVEPVH